MAGRGAGKVGGSGPPDSRHGQTSTTSQGQSGADKESKDAKEKTQHVHARPRVGPANLALSQIRSHITGVKSEQPNPSERKEKDGRGESRKQPGEERSFSPASRPSTQHRGVGPTHRTPTLRTPSTIANVSTHAGRESADSGIDRRGNGGGGSTTADQPGQFVAREFARQMSLPEHTQARKSSEQRNDRSHHTTNSGSSGPPQRSVHARPYGQTTNKPYGHRLPPQLLNAGPSTSYGGETRRPRSEHDDRRTLERDLTGTESRRKEPQKADLREHRETQKEVRTEGDRDRRDGEHRDRKKERSGGERESEKGGERKADQRDSGKGKDVVKNEGRKSGKSEETGLSVDKINQKTEGKKESRSPAKGKGIGKVGGETSATERGALAPVDKDREEGERNRGEKKKGEKKDETQAGTGEVVEKGGGETAVDQGKGSKKDSSKKTKKTEDGGRKKEKEASEPGAGNTEGVKVEEKEVGQEHETPKKRKERDGEKAKKSQGERVAEEVGSSGEGPSRGAQSAMKEERKKEKTLQKEHQHKEKLETPKKQEGTQKKSPPTERKTRTQTVAQTGMGPDTAGPGTPTSSRKPTHGTPRRPNARPNTNTNTVSGSNEPNNNNNNTVVERRSGPFFEEYWDEVRLAEGLANGTLTRGKIRINQANYQEAFAAVDIFDRDVFLETMRDRNRALNGDRVAILVNPKDKWRILKRQYAEETGKREEELTNNPDDYPDNFLRPTGKVVGILEKVHNRVAIGLVVGLAGQGPQKFVQFKPLDSRVPRLMVPTSDLPDDVFVKGTTTVAVAYKTKLFSAQIVNWTTQGHMALAKIISQLGEAGDIEAETAALMVEYSVESAPWNEDALQCLPKAPWTIPEEEIAQRRDLRKQRIFSIDPPTARDLDDALSCERDQDGNFVIGVHIADVTYFVHPNTALDEEAKRRATTIYLVQRNYPMLPGLLCEDLCSLNPGTDRLAFSVFWRMDKDANIVDSFVCRSVINSCAKMSYDHAQCIIDRHAQGLPIGEGMAEHLPPLSGGHSADAVCQTVLDLDSLARKLRQKRFDNGALRLDNVKLTFDLDKETGFPQGFKAYQIKDSNKLVEEFMLLANITVATRLRRAYPMQAFLRRQPLPLEEKLQKTVAQLSTYGVRFKGTSSGDLQETLTEYFATGQPSNAIKGPDVNHRASTVQETVVQLLTKPMQLAQYFCPGAEYANLLRNRLFIAIRAERAKGNDVDINVDAMGIDELQAECEKRNINHKEDPELYRHYALAVPLYTHFTSPIRRYPDVVVHRLLAATLEGEDAYLDVPTLNEIAKHCNDQKLAASNAQDKSDVIYFCAILRAGGPITREGVVTQVLDRSFDVYVPSLGMERRIYLTKTMDSPPIYNYPDIESHSYQQATDTLTISWAAGAGPFPTPDVEGSDVPGSVREQKIGVLSRITVVVSSDNSKIPVEVDIAPLVAHKPPRFGPPEKAE